MTVRKTESQIPGGIANISRLSDHVCVQGSIALVSYLPSTIMYISSTRELAQNTYVVMFDTPPLTDVTYTWRLKMYLPGQSDTNPFFHNEIKGDKGIFELDYQKTEKAWCISDAVKLTVEVELSTGETLILSHQIAKVQKDIDHLERQNVNPNPTAGKPFITKLIEASLADYLDMIEKLDPVVCTQGNLLKSKVISAIIYNTYVQFFAGQALEKYRIMNNGVGWLDYLNKDKTQQFGFMDLPEISDDAYKSVGVCGIRPEILAMFITSSNIAGTPTLTPFTKRKDKDQSSYNREIIVNIAEIIEGTITGSRNIGVDIFNLLRFPKSCIEMCGLLLEEIKKTRSDWRKRNWDSLVSEDDGQLIMLLEDLFYGPSDFTNSRMKIPTQIVNRLNSAYVSMLSSKKLCQRMRSDFYVGIPDSNSLTNYFHNLIEIANLVDVTASIVLTMHHMSDLEEKYNDIGTLRPIYYGGYERQVEFSINYDFGDNYKIFNYKFDLEDFIVLPDFLWDSSSNPEIRLKPIGREAKILDSEISDIEIQIKGLEPNDPTLPEIKRQLANKKEKLDELGVEFVQRIMRTRRVYRLPKYNVLHEVIIVDDQGNNHTVDSTNDYQQSFKSLYAQIMLFYLSAVSTYCAGDGHSVDIFNALSGYLEAVQLSKEYIDSIISAELAPNQITRSNYSTHNISTKPITTQIPYLSIQVPKDQFAQIPRAINVDDCFFRINKDILFNLNSPTTSEMGVGAASAETVLASSEENEHMNLIFDEFRSDIFRSAVPLKLLIFGYADKNFAGNATDRETYNKKLSERRALWMKERFLEYVSLINSEITANTTDPDLPRKVEIGVGKKLEEIVVSWCGDKHAPGDPIDPPEKLKNQAHRDVRMILMPVEDAPSVGGDLHP